MKVFNLQQEGNLPHATICEPLLPVAAQILEALASGLQVVNGHA